MDNPDNPSPETQERWSKDPNNWIWGIFYYNKEDERLFPPKRVAWMGWTVNFANPKSIGAFFVSFAMILVFVYRKQIF